MPTLGEIRDSCLGLSAVVMGSGPSLRELRDRTRLVDREIGGIKFRLPDTRQHDRLREHVVIAVNDAILKVPDADYYVTSDGRMVYYNHWEVVREGRCRVVLPHSSFNYDALRRCGITQNRSVIFTRMTPVPVLRLRHSTTKFVTQSSAMAGLQVAVILGCSPIFLIGCGGRCIEGKKYFWEFDDQPGPGGTKSGHPTAWLMTEATWKRKHPKGKYDLTFDTNKGGKDTETIQKWGMVSEMNPDLQIINATGGLKGSGFEKIAVEDMLNLGTVYTRTRSR